MTRPRFVPAVPPGLVRAALDGHSLLGLVFAALIYLVCLSGTLAVFAEEFEGWEQPIVQPIRSILPEQVDGALRAALADAGGPAQVGALYAVLPTGGLPVLTVTAFGPPGEPSWIGDATDTRTVKHAPWTQFAIDLHTTLVLPSPWGGSLVGLVGVALLALISTGLLSHPRLFKDAFAFRALRSRRLREADLHNRLAVWGLPFHLAITLTGAFFGLSTLLLLGVASIAYHGDTGRAFGALSGPVVTDDSRPAALPALDDLLKALGSDRGTPLYVYIERPGTVGQKITVQMPVAHRLTQGEGEYFDGSGHWLGSGGFAAGSIGRQAYAAAGALHFGTYGGLPVKLAYGALGLALSVIAASGVSIWLIRRRDRGRPAPVLEKIWARLVWGLPLALALASFGSDPLGPQPPTLFFGSLALIVACAIQCRSSGAASHGLRAALSATLALRLLDEILRFRGFGLSGGAGIINTLLFVLLLAVAGALWAGRRMRAP
jgi:uncharacterized iron-regulated membrane protein